MDIERPSAEISQRVLTLFVDKARRAVGIQGELSVRVTSAKEVQELNRRFRRKNKPTDVLSFPSAVPGSAGDIAIAREIAAKNADELGHSLTTELKILILHGLLHLAGYDHESDNGEMTRRESQLRQELGLPAGLIERTDVSRSPNQHVPSISSAQALRLRSVASLPHSAQDDKSKRTAKAQLKLRPLKRGGRRA